MSNFIRLSDDVLDIDEARRTVTSPAAGAISMFIGLLFLYVVTCLHLRCIYCGVFTSLLLAGQQLGCLVLMWSGQAGQLVVENIKCSRRRSVDNGHDGVLIGLVVSVDKLQQLAFKRVLLSSSLRFDSN